MMHCGAHVADAATAFDHVVFVTDKQRAVEEGLVALAAGWMVHSAKANVNGLVGWRLEAVAVHYHIRHLAHIQSVFAALSSAIRGPAMTDHLRLEQVKEFGQAQWLVEEAMGVCSRLSTRAVVYSYILFPNWQNRMEQAHCRPALN